MGRADIHKSTKSLPIHYWTCWNLTLKVDFTVRLSVRLSQLLLRQQWKVMYSRLGCEKGRSTATWKLNDTWQKRPSLCVASRLEITFMRYWNKKLCGKNWHQYLWLLLLVTFNKNYRILIEMFWNPSKTRGHGKIRNWNDVKIKTSSFAVNSKGILINLSCSMCVY